MRLIVSTVGTPPYGISKHLVDIIQLTLIKNQHKLRNSRSFDSQAQIRRNGPSQIQLSFDPTILYLSIPIHKTIDAITQDWSENYDNLKTRTKLMLIDIQQLIEPCVSVSIFFTTILFGST